MEGVPRMTAPDEALRHAMQAASKSLSLAYEQFDAANSDDARDVAYKRIQAAQLQIDAVRGEALLHQSSAV